MKFFEGGIDECDVDSVDDDRDIDDDLDSDVADDDNDSFLSDEEEEFGNISPRGAMRFKLSTTFHSSVLFAVPLLQCGCFCLQII